MKRIDIAKLLRDCPKGMELDCTLFEGLEFDDIVDNDYLPIRCRIKNPNGGYTIYNFTKYGCWLDTTFAKCVLFPKGENTWEGFVPPCKFKDGDVIFTHANCLKVGLGNTWISIFQEKRNGGVATYVDMSEDGKDYYDYIIDDDKALLCMDKDIMRQRLATEEEKQKLFKTIKDNGYRWNEETKTLEKLIQPKFKVGDVVKSKNCPEAGSFVIVDVKEDTYSINLKKYCIKFKDQDNYELVSSTKPKFNVGDKVRHKDDKTVITITGIKDNYYFIQFYNIRRNCYQNEKVSFKDQDEYELVPNKFNINTLVPFESKVLIRNDENQNWLPAFWGYKVVDGFITTFGWCKYCIPYKGNEILFKTNIDCGDFYKTWEK